MSVSLNKADLSMLLGVSEQTVMNWVKRYQLPFIKRGGKGKEWLFNKDDVLIWYHNFKKQGSNDETYEEARKRKVAAEASLAELNLAKEKGKLVEVDKVVKVVEDEYSTIRSKLLLIPTKVAPLVLQTTVLEEAQGILENEINQVLAELSGKELPA